MTRKRGPGRPAKAKGDARVNRTVSLSADLSRYLDAQVKAGGYLSASEVVRHALRLHQQQTSQQGGGNG